MRRISGDREVAELLVGRIVSGEPPRALLIAERIVDQGFQMMRRVQPKGLSAFKIGPQLYLRVKASAAIPRLAVGAVQLEVAQVWSRDAALGLDTMLGLALYATPSAVPVLEAWSRGEPAWA